MFIRYGHIEKFSAKCIFVSELFRKLYLPVVFEMGAKAWNFVAVCGFLKSFNIL